MPAFFPDRNGRRWEIWIGKGGVLPIKRGAAHWAEAIPEHVPALGRARPLGDPTGNGGLVPAKPCLIADHSAGATLALQAVAHGDARRLALDGKVELAAAAGGVTGGHRYRLRGSSAPRTIATNGPCTTQYPANGGRGLQDLAGTKCGRVSEV